MEEVYDDSLTLPAIKSRGISNYNIVENQIYTKGDKKFLCIFNHNISNAITDHELGLTDTKLPNWALFTSDNVQYNLSDNRFSLLKLLNINDFKSIDGQCYEFMLTYDNDKEKFYNWSQTSNPLETSEVQGYDYIADVQINYYGLKGLCKNNSADNDVDGYLQMPTTELRENKILIGQYSGTYLHTAYDTETVKSIQLFIRIDNTPFNAYGYITKRATFMNQYIEEDNNGTT